MTAKVKDTNIHYLIRQLKCQPNEAVAQLLREVEEYIIKLEKEVEGSGWQPIETAPKGMPVIVNGGMAIQKTGNEWYTCMTTEGRKLEWNPTHWMLLPEPPRGEK